MIKNKRQITQEKDRYGGFIDNSDDNFGHSMKTIQEQEINSEIIELANDSEAQIDEARKIRVTSDYNSTTEDYVTNLGSKSKDKDIPAKKTSQPVLHEIVRQSDTDEAVRSEPISIVKEQKLSGRAKKALALYIVLFLAIAIAVIVSGVVLSGIAADISDYENTIESQKETIRLQNEQLGALSDEAVIKDKAEDMGMVVVEDSSSYEQLEIVEPTEDKSGVFDSIRDWLNSIFGG